MQQVYDFKVNETPVRVIIGYIDPTTTATIIFSPDSQFDRLIFGGYVNRNPKDVHNMAYAGRLAVKRALGLTQERSLMDSDGRFWDVDALIEKMHHDTNRKIYSEFRKAQRGKATLEELQSESLEELNVLRMQVANAREELGSGSDGMPLAQGIRLLKHENKTREDRFVELLNSSKPHLTRLAENARSAGSGRLVIDLSAILSNMPL